MDSLKISLSGADYLIICSYFALNILAGILTRKLSGDDMRGYFLSGQRLSWWLLFLDYPSGACWLITCVASGIVTFWSVRKLTATDGSACGLSGGLL